MRRIGGDVGEERLAAPVTDPANRLVEIHVGAVSLERLLLAVAEQDRIKVVGSGRIGRLSDAAALVDHGCLEALIDGALRVVVPEVPLAEDPGAVAGISEHLCDGYFVRRHHGAAQVGVDHTCPVVVAAGHQRGPSRSAHRRYVEARHFDALGRQGVEPGCLQDRVAVRTELSPALIVSHDQDDVGPVGDLAGRPAGRGQQDQRNESESSN